MKKRILLPLALIALLSSCSSTDSVTNPDSPVNLESRLVNIPVCKNDQYVREVSPQVGEAKTRAVEANYEFFEPYEKYCLKYVEGDTLKYLHKDFSSNCASDFDVKVVFDSENQTIYIVELNKRDVLANCLCYYDLESNMGKLVPGEYNVRVYRYWDSPLSSHMFSLTPEFLEKDISYKLFERTINFNQDLDYAFLVPRYDLYGDVKARLVNTPVCKNDAFVREVPSETNESRKRVDGEGEYEFVQPVESINFSYVEGDSLNIQHNDFYISCGTMFRTDVLFEKETNTIHFVEIFNVDMVADCMCVYDLDSNVGKLEPGKYKVLVHRYMEDMSRPWMPSPDYKANDLNKIFETEIDFKQGLEVSYKLSK
jgi:hypothetical protein